MFFRAKAIKGRRAREWWYRSGMPTCQNSKSTSSRAVWKTIDWAERTALPELLGLRVTKSGKDRLYHVGDALFAHRRAIEAGLRKREAGLFGAAGSVVLYDMTNTHFEGLCQKNLQARHGKNKQNRNDSRQVAVGMAFDSRGLALAHDVFEGNIAETKTLERMLDRLALPGTEAAGPVVILDAGFASQQNIALLKARGLGYMINITRGTRARHAEAFAAGGFQTLPGRDRLSPVEVKTISDPDDPDGNLVLCRSALRRADGTLHATRDQERHAKATELLGDYVLKTERSLSASQTWQLYMVLLQAEEGFACLKGTLGLRPNFHQLGHRVEAHICRLRLPATAPFGLPAAGCLRASQPSGFIPLLAYHLSTWTGKPCAACSPPAA